MIRTTDLGVHYRGRPAVSGVNLSLPAGGITALVGPSGCGKSSVLAALNRMTDLVPGARTTGRVAVGGCDVRDPGCSPIALRRRVGMIFQKPAPFATSILRNLTLPLREHGVRGRAELRRRAEEALEEVGLLEEVKDRLRRPALALSGGQQQRLCIARAAALRPDVLLMDEPCSALDPLSSAKVEELIAGFRHRYTVVLVTHNLAQARRLADHTVFLWVRDGSGCVVEQGPTNELFASPKDPLTAAYVRGAAG